MSKMYLNETGLLYPNSDFITGFASVFNLTGNFYDLNSCKTPEEADIKAIRHDWTMVGQDIAQAIEKIKKEENINDSVLAE